MDPTSHSQSHPSRSPATPAGPSSGLASTSQRIAGLAKDHFRVSSIIPPTNSPLVARSTIVIPTQSSRPPLSTGGAATSASPLKQRSVLQRAATVANNILRFAQDKVLEVSPMSPESLAAIKAQRALARAPQPQASPVMRAPSSRSRIANLFSRPKIVTDDISSSSSLSTSRSSSPAITDSHASVARSNTGRRASGSASSSSLSGARASLPLADLYQENNRNCITLMFDQDPEKEFALIHPEFSEITTPELGQRAINTVSQFINNYLTPILETTRQSTELLYQQFELESRKQESSSFFSRKKERETPFTLDMKILTYFNEEDRDRAYEYGPMNDQVRYDCIKGVLNNILVDPKERGVCFAKALSLAIRDSKNDLADWMLFGQKTKLPQKDCRDMDFEQFSPEMRIRLGIKMSITESNYDLLFHILDKIPKEDQISYLPIALHDLCSTGHEEALEEFLSEFDPPPEIKEAALACAKGTDREKTVKTKLGL